MKKENRPAVLVIGIDSAEPSLIERWAAEGELPTFDLLLKGAAWTRLKTPPGFYSAGVWPSITTGVTVGRHGRHSDHRYQPETYGTIRDIASKVSYPVFWERLSEAGQRCAIIDVPQCPLNQDINGIQVWDWGSHDAEDTFRTVPEELAADIVQRFGSDEVGQCDRGGLGQPDIRRFADGLLNRIRGKTALSEYLLGKGGWDFFMTCYSEPHCVGHNAWHQHDPEHPRHDAKLAREMGDPVKAVYKAVDEGVGRLLKQVPASTRVFVFSSHGMGPNYRSTFALDRILRALEHKSQRRGIVFETLYRAWQMLPLFVRGPLQSLKVKVRNGLLGSDRKHRQFFSVQNTNTCGAIRINVRGRDPLGTVERGKEYDAVCADLAEALMEIEDAGTGEPLVSRVWRTEDVYGSDHAANLPDMMVEWKSLRPVTAVRSPRFGELGHISYRGHRSGDHLPEGMLFAAGPGVKRGELAQSPQGVDLAPTICGLFRVSRKGMDGRVVKALLGKGPVVD